MEEHDHGARRRRVPDLWRMSALLAMCPKDEKDVKDVQDEMLMRLDEIGENYKTVKTKVISCSFHRAERSAWEKPTLQDRWMLPT